MRDEQENSPTEKQSDAFPVVFCFLFFFAWSFLIMDAVPQEKFILNQFDQYIL